MSQVPKPFPCLIWLKFPFYFLRSHLLCWQSSWKLCGVQKYQLTLIFHISDLISPEYEPYLSKIHSPRICDSFCEKRWLSWGLGFKVCVCVCTHTCAHTVNTLWAHRGHRRPGVLRRGSTVVCWPQSLLQVGWHLTSGSHEFQADDLKFWTVSLQSLNLICKTNSGQTKNRSLYHQI